MKTEAKRGEIVRVDGTHVLWNTRSFKMLVAVCLICLVAVIGLTVTVVKLQQRIEQLEKTK